MVEETVVIVNKIGVHARPAAMIFRAAGNYGANISLIKGGRSFNAKSMLSIMSAAIKQGDEIIVQAEGADEKEAFQAIAALIKSGFGEE